MTPNAPVPAAASRSSSGHTDHPDLALLVVVVGVLITAVDTTIVVLALPEIQRTFHIGLSSVIWVIIGYLFVITLVSTQVGRLGDMFGRVLMYEAGFVIFVVGSLACALAWNELSLILFRLLQGVGGSFIAANSGAVIADTFPAEKRGRAYGFNAVGFNTGAVLGVVLGGVIVTYVSWRWIFWINVPIGIGAVATARRVLADRSGRQRRAMDWWGMASIGVGLFCLLWGMVDLITESLSPTIVGFFAVGALMLLVFWRVERRATDPMLNFSLFHLPTMTPSLLAAMFQSLANFSVLFLLLMYLQGVHHLSPIHASMLLVPGYVIGGVVGPFAGRFADRHGAVLPATVGLGIQVLALLVYAQLGDHSALAVVVVAYAVGAVGAGCFFPSNNSAVMKVAPGHSFGLTSGLLRTFANVGMVFSFALAILVASSSIGRHAAFAIFVGTGTLSASTTGAFITGLHAAFYSSTSLMVLAAALSASRVRLRRPVN
jgi:EmrB/QacA subfamily drug resistance transporter